MCSVVISNVKSIDGYPPFILYFFNQSYLWPVYSEQALQMCKIVFVFTIKH